MSQTLKAIILWNLYTALGRLLVIITANIMALSMYLALFYQLGTITAPILQMRRLRLGKEMPFHFGALFSHITYTCKASYKLRLTFKSTPAPSDRSTHTTARYTCVLTHMMTHIQRHVYRNACVHVGSSACVYIYMPCAHSPYTTGQTSESGKRVQIKGPKSSPCLLPTSSKRRCWRVCTGLGGACTGSPRLKGQS